MFGVQSMLKQFLIALVPLLLAGPAFATFEIRDPAAEILEEQDKSAADFLAEKSCVQFLLDGADDSKDYWSVINTVKKATAEQQTVIAVEDSLKSWCIDHPKQNLLQAAEGLDAIFD